MRKRRIFLDTWQSVSRARISYKAARCGWRPVQRASRSLHVTSDLMGPAFPTGNAFHPPAICIGLHRCPALSTTHRQGVDPLGEEGKSPDWCQDPGQGNSLPLFLLPESLGPQGRGILSQANLHCIFVPIKPITEITVFHECMGVLSTPRSKICISKEKMLTKMIIKYIKIM